MKLHYIIFALLASCGLLANAQSSDPMYMVLNMRDGHHKAVNIEEVNRLTFPSGTMTVEKKNATTEKYVLTEIESMEFSTNEAGGVQAMGATGSDIAFNRTSATIAINGEDGGEFAIYNVNGVLVLSFAVAQGVHTLDVSALASGAYIIVYNGQTFKFVK